VSSHCRKGIVPKAVPESCAARNQALLPVYVGDPGRARAIGAALGPSSCDDVVDAIVNDSIVTDPRRQALERALARYRGPALVVIGARDPFAAVWAGDAARPLRGARLTKRVVPNAGHFLWLESPAFMPLLRSFLNRT
jgi:pimeloyl-ACP methyl ester carboxylesterase